MTLPILPLADNAPVSIAFGSTVLFGHSVTPALACRACVRWIKPG
jgi:hypothetical protein